MSAPNYYAIIPASVRYNKELSANSKLLYGEISALSNKTGECTAKNEYFAGIYSVSPETISRWIKKLADLKLITVKYARRGAEITGRKIKLSDCQKDQPTIDEKINRTIDEKIKDNNTSINIKYNSKNYTIGKIQSKLVKKCLKEKEKVAPKEKEIELLLTWLSYRHEIKKPYRSKDSIELFFGNIDKHGIQTMIQSVKKAIECGYQGYFPENKKHRTDKYKIDETAFEQRKKRRREKYGSGNN